MGLAASSHRNAGFDWSGIPGINRQCCPEASSQANELRNCSERRSSAPNSLWGIGPALAVSGRPWTSLKDESGDSSSASGSMEGSSSSKEEDNEKDLIPCVFSWTQGGHNVYLSGSFNNWSPRDRIKLVRNGHEFTVVKNIPRGKHFYKFIVDDVWRYATDQQTSTDENGNVNNIIDITTHRSASFSVPTDLEQVRLAVFHQYIPEPSEYSSEAPPIPILFSKTVCPAADPPPRTAAPLHSIANHLYHDAFAPNVFGPHISVMATTHRWRGQSDDQQANDIYFVGQKHSTCVFVTLNPLFLASTPQLVHDFGLCDAVKSMIYKSFIEDQDEKSLASQKITGGTQMSSANNNNNESTSSNQFVSESDGTRPATSTFHKSPNRPPDHPLDDGNQLI